LTCSGIHFGQLEPPVGHGLGPHRRPGESWQHRGEIVSPIETVLELAQITRHVLLVDSPVGSNNGGLDIPQCCVDPSEGGRPCRGSAGAGFNDLMRTTGVSNGTETGKTIADDLARRIEAP
jgi:hypothetical protein